MPRSNCAGRPERLEKRVLHQVLGVGRPPCQPERRSVQAVDVRQRFARKPTVGILIPRGSGRSRRGASTEGHESFCQRPVRETRGGAPLFQDCTRRVTAPFAPEDTRRGNPTISGLNAWLSIGTCLARNGGFRSSIVRAGDPAIATTVLATVTSATPTTCVAAFAQPSCLASAAALRGELCTRSSRGARSADDAGRCPCDRRDGFRCRRANALRAVLRQEQDPLRQFRVAHLHDRPFRDLLLPGDQAAPGADHELRGERVSAGQRRPQARSGLQGAARHL